MKSILSACLFLVLSLHLRAQKVRVIVPRQPVVTGTAFQLQFVILDPAGFAGITLPEVDSLRLVSGPNHYKGTILIDGKNQSIENITYTMVASRIGTFRIKEVTAHFRNGPDERVEDAIITIVPLPRASFTTRSSYTDIALYAPASRTDLERLISENLFIRAEVNKRSCFIGEAVVATYKLYSRLQSTSEVMNSPSLYGFSVTDILNIHEAHQAVETINGKVFNTSILRKLQLFPEQMGTLVIDAMQLKNEIEFNDSVHAGEKTIVEKILASKPVTIQVKPLPDPRPDDFSGAVGQFRIHAKMEPATLHSEQQGRFTISVSGKGNFIQFGQPKIKWPDAFDVFDPAINDRLDKTRSPTEGIRSYSFPLTADSAGNYMIPPVSFSFFDVATGSFKTAKTDSIRVIVLPGSEKPNGSGKGLKVQNSGRNLYWIIAAGMLTVLMSLYYFIRNRKQPASKPPVQNTVDYISQLDQLARKDLTQQQVCMEIRKILLQFAKDHQLTPSQVEEMRLIQSDCGLMAYSRAEEQAQISALIGRSLLLIRKVTGKA